MDIYSIIIWWHIVGLYCCCGINSAFRLDALFELYNPVYVYNHISKINWFGAFMLALVYTIMTPIFAMIYWVYKLCTIKR